MMIRLGALTTACLLVFGCANQEPAQVGQAGQAGAKPRLVVFMAVDGFPERQVLDYRDQLAADGLARFLDRGAWFADAHYGHAFTVTAAGHATMLTGAYPHRTGIIGNDWRNAKGELEYCTGDEAYKYLGAETKKLDGTSPKNLMVETVGDVLKGANPASKVIAISGKDRGAILPGGHKGQAYMYQTSNGTFSSTTYYMQQHPKWAADWNAAKPADKYFKTEWKLLLDESAYSKSIPDNQKWYLKGGALPKVIGDGSTKPDGPFYSQLLASPYSDVLTLDFARAAIEGEGMGQDDVPDLLAVSLSGHDYVNHAYSAESRLSQDHTLRLDRALQDFFKYLDEKVGKDKYVLVLTADHGFMPAPEQSQSLGRDAGKLSGSQSLAAMNKTLSAKYGEGQWIRYYSARGIVLNRDLAAARGIVIARVLEDARKELSAQPGVQVAYTREELETGSRAGQPFFEQMQKTWNRERSGDVEFVFKPYWMMTSATAATTHGSPHPYDTNVPILLYGPAWVKPGRRDGRVEVVDIAPTLAAMLGVAAPSGSEGKPLPVR
jgi:predicted AlkP superfamily pyrophosphatase or phosphodiesterase